MKKFLLMILFIGIFWSFVAPSYGISYVMHTVEAEDTYWALAQKYETNIDDIKKINDSSSDILLENSLIKIQSLEKNITIRINNEIILPDENPYLEDARTFVPIRFIAEALDIDIIDWDDNTKTALLKNDALEVKLPYGLTTAQVNNQPVNLDAPINILNGRIFVPIRFVSETFNCSVSWDQDNYIVDINSNPKNTVDATLTETVMIQSYTEDDLYWLARIVNSEAEAEPYEGKLAVANVIINRKNSSDFPNTIKEVIFQKANGYYQFSPVANGTIYKEPSEESVQAAKSALTGNNNIGNALFFLNPRKSISFWITATRKYYTTIQLHDFYL